MLDERLDGAAVDLVRRLGYAGAAAAIAAVARVRRDQTAVVLIEQCRESLDRYCRNEGPPWPRVLT